MVNTHLYKPMRSQFETGDSRFEGHERVCYTRDQLLQLMEVGNIPEAILKIKQEVEAEFLGEDQNWGHVESSMPLKKPDKSKAIVPSSQNSKSPPVPPLDMVNKFQVLRTIPKSNYSSVLVANPYANPLANTNPSSVVATGSKASKSSSVTRTEYIPKSYAENMVFIEPAHYKITNVLDLVKHYLPNGSHYIPKYRHKTLSFYRDILYNHQSIVIKSIPDKVKPGHFIYHCLYIHNIISMDAWGHPMKTRNLPNHDQVYTYYDYIDAWFHVFLYQNETYSHSWYIAFDLNFKCPLPSWFSQWWINYGAIPELLPDALSTQFNYFATVYKLSAHQAKFPILLHFIIKYKIPWLFKWQFGIIEGCIARQYYVKWWDAYKYVDYIITKIQTDFPIHVHAPTPLQAHAPAQQISANDPYAQLSQQSPLPTTRLGDSQSPQHSSKHSSKSKSKSKSSKKEDDRIAKLVQEAVQHALANKNDNEDSSASSTESHYGPAQPDSPVEDDLEQFAQDPYA